MAREDRADNIALPEAVTFAGPTPSETLTFGATW